MNEQAEQAEGAKLMGNLECLFAERVFKSSQEITHDRNALGASFSKMDFL